MPEQHLTEHHQRLLEYAYKRERGLRWQVYCIEKKQQFVLVVGDTDPVSAPLPGWYISLEQKDATCFFVDVATKAIPSDYPFAVRHIPAAFNAYLAATSVEEALDYLLEAWRQVRA